MNLEIKFFFIKLKVHSIEKMTIKLSDSKDTRITKQNETENENENEMREKSNFIH
jgi:hypothetical protein